MVNRTPLYCRTNARSWSLGTMLMPFMLACCLLIMPSRALAENTPSKAAFLASANATGLAELPANKAPGAASSESTKGTETTKEFVEMTKWCIVALISLLGLFITAFGSVLGASMWLLFNHGKRLVREQHDEARRQLEETAEAAQRRMKALREANLLSLAHAHTSLLAICTQVLRTASGNGNSSNSIADQGQAEWMALHEAIRRAEMLMSDDEEVVIDTAQQVGAMKHPAALPLLRAAMSTWNRNSDAGSAILSAIEEIEGAERRKKTNRSEPKEDAARAGKPVPHGKKSSAASKRKPSSDSKK